MKAGTTIESIGIYLPEQIKTTASIVDELKLPGALKLELMTGIIERRICSEREDALFMAVEAVKDCLQHASIHPNEVEMVIFCAISRYMEGLKYLYEPAISMKVIAQIGMENAFGFDITNACAGMLTGIHIGSDFIERGETSNCLVVSGEYISSLSKNAIKNIDSFANDEIASLTLGDAGGAVLLKRSESEDEKIIAAKFITLGTYSDLCIGYQSNQSPGGVMMTKMKEIHDASIRNAPSVIEEALLEAGLTFGQIDYIIPHQTSKQAISAGYKYFSAHFGEMPGEVVVNLDKVGNTASTSHLLALYTLLKEKKCRKGDKIMLLSFASGLVIGVIIFTILNLIDRYGRVNS